MDSAIYAMQLFGLNSLLDDYKDKTALVRNELRKLFLDKILVKPEKIEKGTKFTVSSMANPFNLVRESDLQLSIIAEQGLEPRTRGL